MQAGFFRQPGEGDTSPGIFILRAVDDLDNGPCAGQDVWREMIGDAINYLILLEALSEEQNLSA